MKRERLKRDGDGRKEGEGKREREENEEREGVKNSLSVREMEANEWTERTENNV